jgi:membrane protease YdiL (CAAX protease family)
MPAATGVRLLLAAVLLEVVCLVVPSIPLWLLLPSMLALSLIAVRAAGVRLHDIGLRSWREWTTTEKSYFLQVIVIANVVFPLVLAGPVTTRVAQPGWATSLWSVFVPYLFFGFYQEVVYRGMVQTALERWWCASDRRRERAVYFRPVALELPLGACVARSTDAHSDLRDRAVLRRGVPAIP